MPNAAMDLKKPLLQKKMWSIFHILNETLNTSWFMEYILIFLFPENFFVHLGRDRIVAEYS